MERRHRRPGIAAERAIERRPGPPPGPFPDLDHHPPHRWSRLIAFEAQLIGHHALLRRPPGWRGRNGEVHGAAEVEGGRHLPGRLGEAIVVAKQDPGQRQVRLDEPGPVGDGERAIERRHLSGPREGALKSTVGQLAQAERAVGADRIANPEPAAKPLRIVVRQLVDDRERPHLEREQRRIASLGAGTQHRQRQRARRGGHGGDRRRDAQPPPGERDQNRAGERRGRAPLGRAASAASFASGGVGPRRGEYRFLPRLECAAPWRPGRSFAASCFPWPCWR